MSQSRPVAVVTGASRGAGRGIAVALGTHGCTVYVTGRSEKTGDASLPGTIYETAGLRSGFIASYYAAPTSADRGGARERRRIAARRENLARRA